MPGPGQKQGKSDINWGQIDLLLLIGYKFAKGFPKKLGSGGMFPG